MRSNVPLRLLLGLLLAGLATAWSLAQRTPPTASAPPVAGSPPAASSAVVPFTIHVEEAVLADLKERLSRTRFPDELEGSGWTYGTNIDYLKQLVAYWRDQFDWREQERRLNRFEHFKTNIDGLDIHFIHRRSKQPNALPLVMTHGWPSTFIEFVKVIEPLADPVGHGGRPEDAFDVVVTSVPGYGFSGKPRQAGYGRERTGAIFAKLMARLGYTRYGVQGGDIGAGIGTSMALNDAAHVAGLHLNSCSGEPPDASNPNAGLSATEVAKMRERDAFWTEEERGYSHIQGTRPQTIGYALDDSPVALAAWIVEKYRLWCDCDGDPEKRFTKEELLTNITIYWVTQTATSAARFYYETRHNPVAPRRVEVPTGCASFPKDLRFTPRPWLEKRYNLARFTVMPRGGHFAALEQPELFVDDVRATFRNVRTRSVSQ